MNDSGDREEKNNLPKNARMGFLLLLAAAASFGVGINLWAENYSCSIGYYGPSDSFYCLPVLEALMTPMFTTFPIIALVGFWNLIGAAIEYFGKQKKE
jgi:hypothetical protein